MLACDPYEGDCHHAPKPKPTPNLLKALAESPLDHCNNDPACFLNQGDDIIEDTESEYYWRIGNETCALKCQGVLQGLFVFGWMMDSIATGLNLGFALVADVALLINPIFYLALMPEYKLLSIIPNLIGTTGGVAWILSGFLSGDNYLEISRNDGVVDVSGTLAQDTIATILFDGAGWLAPWAQEPNGAFITNGVGVAYDMLRNPFDPIMPTIFQPTFSFSIDTK